MEHSTTIQECFNKHISSFSKTGILKAYLMNCMRSGEKWISIYFESKKFKCTFKETNVYTARRENLYTFIIVFISEFVQIFSPRPVCSQDSTWGTFFFLWGKKVLITIQRERSFRYDRSRCIINCPATRAQLIFWGVESHNFAVYILKQTVIPNSAIFFPE